MSIPSYLSVALTSLATKYFCQQRRRKGKIIITSIHVVPAMSPSTLHEKCHSFIHSKNLRKECNYYSHFIDEELKLGKEKLLKAHVHLKGHG